MRTPRGGFTSRIVGALILASPSLAAQQTGQDQQAGAEVEPTPKGIQWTTGDYKWKIGGYIKVDVIHDFDEIGSTDFFDVRTIPTAGANEPGDSTRIHARQTRLNLDVTGPTSAGAFRAFFEGDFFSDQNGFRMRHAYGTVGHVLGGQTWSTFMDENAMPETLDFESPVAFPLIRQAQVRWTQELENGNYFAVSLEDPDSDVIPAAGLTGETDEPLPDLNARVHLKNPLGHVQLGLFSGMARFDPGTGSTNDAWLWGANLSTKLTTWGSDNAIAQITYGEGVARYRGGNTAAYDANGNLDAIPTLGILGSYQHYWAEDFRSSVGYSWGDGDVPSGAPPATTTEQLQYGFANLIWQFADRAWVGIEYLYGERQTFDNADGTAHRIQISLRFDI
ncbi:MAG: hypothetical protein EYC70_08050 [Planctomycetota bacterium]|nr:MAG: hypothetical protein EYC70_08050 [Planctomycetota bacterium]